MTKKKLALIGTGPMAISYFQVLSAINEPFNVIGRSEKSAASFEEKTGYRPISGGLEHYLAANTIAPETAIVAVGVPELAQVTQTLIKGGCKRILLEKPGGLDLSEVSALSETAGQHNAEVLIAYNRRYYTSVQKMMSLVQEEGGIRSLFFEFTEWGHVIKDSPQREIVKANWLYANSTHVIDLALYFSGPIKEVYSSTGGESAWHPPGAIYVGAGESASGIHFSYHANWNAPGRWGLEVLTEKNRYFLRPMEKLYRQQLGSVKLEEVALDDQLDLDFKPGLYKQVENFLSGKTSLLPAIAQQNRNMSYYQHILTGKGFRSFA